MIKWNWIMPTLMALALATAVFITSGCKKAEPAQSGTQAHQYTCSMHPDVVKDAPGDCPKCGMKLVEKN
jgi:Cu(I)/Ag(I) efflux system membrane fusion protein